MILVVDRTELEGQLKGWVERLLGEMQKQDIATRRANTKAELQDLLDADFRGLIVVDDPQVRGDPKGQLHARQHLRLHRRGASLGRQGPRHLPDGRRAERHDHRLHRHADRQDRAGRRHVQDLRHARTSSGYLDKYSINESIEDETTLPIKHVMAPSEMTVPAERLDKEFFELAEAEGVTDIEELNKVLDRAVGLRTFLKADDRVEKVAAFVAEHFKENVLPLGYKAFRRRPSTARPAPSTRRRSTSSCRRSGPRPIYTENAADIVDRPLVAELQLSEEREEDVRLLFKKADKDPKILIVTDKLLTGYDAPLLYCLYLDKPMRDHVLLQAIARVNRPYVDAEGVQKRVGLVVDFVGVLRELKKALQFDSADVSGVIEDLDVLLEDFHREDREGREGLSRRRRRRRRRRAAGASRLRPLPRPGAAQGVLRGLQGHRDALGNPVAVARSCAITSRPSSASRSSTPPCATPTPTRSASLPTSPTRPAGWSKKAPPRRGSAG